MRFDQPSLLDRTLNRVFGFLVKTGLGLSHNFFFEVRGRKTGGVYSTPVNLLEHKVKGISWRRVDTRSGFEM